MALHVLPCLGSMQCSAIAPRDTHVSNKVKQLGNRHVCEANVCLLRTASSLDTGCAAHRGWTTAPHSPMTNFSSNRSQELALGATTGELPQVAPSPTPRTNNQASIAMTLRDPCNQSEHCVNLKRKTVMQIDARSWHRVPRLENYRK